jgi:DNA-binding response OmpR family regulator
MIPPPILIVDDESDLLELFTVMLRHLPYPVLKASRGEDAFKILATITPILMILDVAMVSPNGLDVLRYARSDSRFNATKIIILTAVPGRVEKRDVDQVDLLLAKPISGRDLERSVAQLLDSQ